MVNIFALPTTALPPKDLTVVGGWRGAFAGSFNTSAADWLSFTVPYETWLSSIAPAQPVQIQQCLAFGDNNSGSYDFNGWIFTLQQRYWSLHASRPNLMLRIAVPMVIREADWDALLAGSHDSVWAGIDNGTVLHDNAFPGTAALTRFRIGWEMNGLWEPWGPRFPGAGGPGTYPSSTYGHAKFRAGWRRIAGLFAASRARGAKLVWNPALPRKDTSWVNQWPGYEDDGVTINPAYEALVDVIGGDAYDQWLGGPSLTGAQRWTNMYSGSDGISSLLAFAAAHGDKPVSFDEWGIDLRLSDVGNPTKPSGDDAYYIQQMALIMQGLIDAGKFDGHVYWESNSLIQSEISTSSISPLCQAAFKATWGAP